MGMTTSPMHISHVPETAIAIEDLRRSALGEFDGPGSSINRLLSEQSLTTEVRLACREEGIAFERLGPIQRLFLTHYRCPMCKLVPLYYVNVMHPKRVRCGKCGILISFRNSGKYGKLRKKIAFMLNREGGFCSVSQ